ncbi:Allantoate [Aspergillus sp. HF37]|nr:Allantoate [Aspergillus sp. HF37]
MEKLPKTSQGAPPDTSGDVGDVKLGGPSVDTALGQMLEVESSPQLERKVLWKIDLILMPLMCFAYFLQFVDKMVLSQTTLFGLREDLHLVGDQYAWSSAIFYFGYLAWSWPNAYLLARLPIGKYLGSTVILWGGILMCHAACKDFAGLATARFFLGVSEAAVVPGFSLVTGIFYTREEQPKRQAGWYFGNTLAALVGSLITYGIGHITGAAVSEWQLMFLILGAITAGFGLVLVPILPDSPAKAIFLSVKERAIAVQRTLRNKTGILDNCSFNLGQAIQALKDPQAWFLVLYTFCVNLWNGGLTTFIAIIIKGFGFGTFETLVYQVPFGAAEIIYLVFTVLFASHVRSRRIFAGSSRIFMMIFSTIASLLGVLLIWKLDPSNKAGRLMGIYISVGYAVNIPLCMSLVSSNVAGFSKRSTVSAMVFVAYCLGNIAGPQFYNASEAPSYPTGIASAVSGLTLGAFFLCCLWVYYIWENDRRDKRYGLPSEMTDSDEMRDELSNKTDREIPSFRYVC